MKILKDIFVYVVGGLVVFAILETLPAIYETVKTHAEQTGSALTAYVNLPLWTLLVFGFISALAVGKLLLTLACHLFPRFIIVEGKYGIVDNYKDVTDRLNEYVVKNKLRIKATNNYLGRPDPAGGMTKVLIIRYRVWWITREKKYIEHDQVSLP